MLTSEPTSPFLQVNQAISSMKEDKIFATQLSLHRRQGFIALKEVMFKSSLIHVIFFANTVST